MGSKPDDEGSACAKALPAELADIQLATRSPHFGVAGIANVGVVRSDHFLRLRSARDKDPLQRVKHVPVTPIPGFVRAVVHYPTISFGIAAALIFDSSDTMAATALSLGQLVITGRVIRAGKTKAVATKAGVGFDDLWLQAPGETRLARVGSQRRRCPADDAGDIVPTQSEQVAFATIQ